MRSELQRRTTSIIRSGAVVVIAVIALVLPQTKSHAESTAQGGDPVLVGAGDIASCRSGGDELTANLLDKIPGVVFAVGDLLYGDPGDDYAECYGPSWGRHKDRTRPVPGNHDYKTPGAAKYFEYFGANAGEAGKGYYSFNLGTWHIVALNSNAVKGLQAETVKWLKADLAANPAHCVLAISHHPVFSSGRGRTSPYSRAFFRLLYEAGADVMISGDAHHYERFAPQDLNGQKQPARGIRQFIVGTGGATLTELGPIWRNSEAYTDQVHGVLKLTLHPGSYSWEFVPVEGKTYTDSGTAPCVSA